MLCLRENYRGRITIETFRDVGKRQLWILSLSLSVSLSSLSPLSLLSLSLSLPPALISSPISYSTSTTRNPTKIYK